MKRRQWVIGFAVEGLVIVTSILLAFAVDAMWDRRPESTMEWNAPGFRVGADV